MRQGGALPFPRKMLKKSASGVLGPLSCSRTSCTLRALKGLWPCWTVLFEHPALQLVLCVFHVIERLLRIFEFFNTLLGLQIQHAEKFFNRSSPPKSVTVPLYCPKHIPRYFEREFFRAKRVSCREHHKNGDRHRRGLSGQRLSPSCAGASSHFLSRVRREED